MPEGTILVSLGCVLQRRNSSSDLVLLADVGASQFIIDGKIGLKNDSVIKEFTKTGLKFEDDSLLEADVVIFATGLGDSRDGYKKVLSEELGGKLKPLWGLDASGEVNGAWRDIGVDNLWCMIGNLAMCRYHSRHIALREFLCSYFLFLAVVLTIADKQRSRP